MTKKTRKAIIFVLVFALLGAAGAFADVSIGAIGGLYMDDAEWAAATGYSVSQAFRNGEGIYYGLMGEFMGKNISLGGSYMASFYNAIFDPTIPMVDMDMNLYLGGHFLGTRKVLDPFVEAGLGYIFKDYNDYAYDDDPLPLTELFYWYLGAGLGANLGPVGFFGKFIYHIPFKNQPERQIEYVDEYGVPQVAEIDLADYALKPYKIVIGAKVMFPLIPRRERDRY